VITDAWPAASWEELPWQLPEDISKTQRRRPRTYLASVTASIADVERLLLPREVEASVVEASMEIARFDTEVGGLVA
jgi:hypothetical protein